MSNQSTVLANSLGTLDDAFKLNADSQEKVISGEPLLIPLDMVYPDPDQPRKEFDETALKELSDSIKEQGVLQPIAVGPADDEGRHMIKQGERRWRASCLADGVIEIPAFIDVKSDSYGQMIENIQREDLQPMEIGLWICAKIEAGAKAKEVGEKLGKDASYISVHRTLPNLPPALLSLYGEGSLRSARLLYSLKTAYDLNEDETKKFCARTSEKGGTTKREIDAFLAELKGVEKGTKTTGSDGEDDGIENEPTTKEPKPTTDPQLSPMVTVRIGHNDKLGFLLLDKPSEKDQVWVNFDDSVALMDMDQLNIVGVKLV
ncbi:MAG: ParB/RepB/Spo0J family partition protein [Pseudomonadales bacterium]|nr:ParB/RepB/Spo0J family partition protein [Pseudomonadales bacterium]